VPRPHIVREARDKDQDEQERSHGSHDRCDSQHGIVVKGADYPRRYVPGQIGDQNPRHSAARKRAPAGGRCARHQSSGEPIRDAAMTAINPKMRVTNPPPTRKRTAVSPRRTAAPWVRPRNLTDPDRQLPAYPCGRPTRPCRVVCCASCRGLPALRDVPEDSEASRRRIRAEERHRRTSTVKTHMRHIYEKLGAHKRTEAVERARDLGLLGPSARSRR